MLEFPSYIFFFITISALLYRRIKKTAISIVASVIVTLLLACTNFAIKEIATLPPQNTVHRSHSEIFKVALDWCIATNLQKATVTISDSDEKIVVESPDFTYESVDQLLKTADLSMLKNHGFIFIDFKNPAKNVWVVQIL